MKLTTELIAQFGGTCTGAWHRMLMSLSCIFMLCTVSSFSLFAQSEQIEVKGKVTSQGEPVIGAGVIIKGTTIGSATDVTGTFTLRALSDAILTVSSIGYSDAEVAVNGRGYIEIELAPESLALDDVVVVGYGTQKKINLTGAVASVDTEVMEARPIANALEALQGSVPGLIIQQGTSTPGSSPSINVRGLNTLNDNSPLVIIDGIEGSIANLNPSDIDQISVLKDASSTAIYGSRASNGVILVTTKKGQEGKMEVSYDFNYGFQMPTSLPKIVDSWIYAELYNEAEVNSGRPAKYTQEDIANFKNNGPNVNWVRALYDDWSPQQSHSVSMTGGTEKLSYMASIGFLDQDSMFKGSKDYGYKRFNARLNLSHKVTDRLTINLTSQFARNTITDHAYQTYWIVEQANRMPPVYEIKNPDGTYTYPAGSNANGLQRIEQGGYVQSVNDELAGTLSAEWELFDGFKLVGSIGARTWNNGKHTHRNALEGSSADVLNQMQEESYRSLYTTANAMATYNKTIGKHTFGALLGYSYEGFSDKSYWTRRDNIDNKYDILVGSLSGDDVANGGDASDWSMYSGFARLTYNYDEKYLLEFNLRNDYSSYFAEGNRSGLFPSLSAGWRISSEKFWDNIRDYIPSLKLRASYGLVGNNRISAYSYMQTVTVTQGGSFNNQLVNTLSFSSANPDIEWEKTAMADVGIDLGLLRNNLNITFDWFYNRTYDILFGLPVPGIFGNGAPTQNAGVVDTSGWEFSFSYLFKTGPVNHHVSGNVSDSWNKVVDIKGTRQINGTDVTTILMEGYPMNSYYAYKTDGFFQNEAECAAGPVPDGITVKPGDIRYVDKTGEGRINSDDRFVLGNDFPRYLFSLTYGFEVKGFDFSMMWQGVGKRSKWMRGEAVEAFHNNNEGPVLDFHLDRWTPSNPDATYPRLTRGSESANTMLGSDFWIRDAKYLRLKNVQVGYTFPKRWMEKVKIQNLRIYASLQNALTFSAMPGGWDPEYTGDGSGRTYPVARVFSLGLNVKF